MPQPSSQHAAAQQPAHRAEVPGRGCLIQHQEGQQRADEGLQALEGRYLQAEGGKGRAVWFRAANEVQSSGWHAALGGTTYTAGMGAQPARQAVW